MNKLFSFIFFIFCIFYGLIVYGETHNLLSYKDYKIIIDQLGSNDGKSSILKILRNNILVAKIQNLEEYLGKENYRIEVKEFYKNLHFLGEGKEMLLISEVTAQTGECCFNYYFYQLEPEFKYLQKIEGGTDIEIIPQDNYKPALIRIIDPVFDSYPPEVILRFNGERFVFDKKLMKKQITDIEYNDIVQTLKQDLTPEEPIAFILRLIYSGNGHHAIQLVETFMPEKKLCLLCTLKYSPYIKEILEINDKAITIPSEEICLKHRFSP